VKQLRYSIFALLLLLALFFNIERLDFGNQNVIDIETFVYGLGTLAVLSTLMVPSLRARSFLTLLITWLGIYLISKLFIFSDRPLLGGMYTYLTITEVCFICALFWLTYQLVQNIHDFEKAVENITFSHLSNRVQKLEQTKDIIQTEMFRSRHNHHPLSIIIVEPEVEAIKTTLHRMVREVQQTMMSYYMINNLGRILGNYLRRSDLVLENQEKNQIMLICPETNSADATLLIDYINEIVAKHLDISIKCGTASFPNGAVTFEELVRQAEAQLYHSNVRPVNEQHAQGEQAVGEQATNEQSSSPTLISIT
jgi:hypothetical protein